MVSAVRKDSDGTLLMSVVYGADGMKIAIRPHGYGERSESLTYTGGMVFAYGASGYTLEGYRFGEGILTEGDVRYHEKDHLGNVRVVTNRKGEVLEQNDYYPYGMRHPDSGHAYDAGNRYRYNGKELLDRAGLYLYDFGARLYDPRTGRWYVRDPLSEKYYGLSPYNYVMGNPVNFIDPDGRIIVFAENVSQAFIDKFNGWIAFMASKGTDDLYQILQASSNVYTVTGPTQIGDDFWTNGFQRHTRTIIWNPDRVMFSDNGIATSPGLALDHEFAHAVRWDTDPAGYENDISILRNDFYNEEENRVINGREQRTALKHGEIKPGQRTRTKYRSNLGDVNVSNMTIEEILEFIMEHNDMIGISEESAPEYDEVVKQKNNYNPKASQYHYIDRKY